MVIHFYSCYLELTDVPPRTTWPSAEKLSEVRSWYITIGHALYISAVRSDRFLVLNRTKNSWILELAEKQNHNVAGFLTQDVHRDCESGLTKVYSRYSDPVFDTHCDNGWLYSIIM